MEKNNSIGNLLILRWIPLCLMLILAAFLAFSTARLTNWFIGAGIFTGLFGPFMLQAFRNILNQPPHKGVLTFFGTRTSVVLDEGWRFLPFFPFVFGFVLVPVTRVTAEFKVKAKTPDKADSEIPVTTTWRPINEIKQKKVQGLLIKFLDSGGNEGVEKQLAGKIDERVREWAIADEEGPQDWKELQKSRLEAISILTKTIGFNEVTEIPSYAQNVPTVIWMRFFTEPRPEEPSMEKEKKWMESKWAKVRDVYDPLSDEEKQDLQNAIKMRRKEVQDLRSGIGSIILEDLGVKIERINVGDIKVLGEVEKASEKEAKEEQDRAAEAKELEHIRTQTRTLREDLKINNEQALEVIQTERGKVTKNISENKITISPETQEMIKSVADVIGSLLKGGKS